MDAERVALEQPGPGGVYAYRIGDTLVDTGHAVSDSVELLRDALDDGPLEGIERVVLTHPHADHAGGSLIVPEVTELPHVVFRGADTVLRNFDEYVRDARTETATITAPPGTEPEPDETYFPDLDYATDDLVIDRVVEPGDTVRLGRHECTVVHTPGHSRQHMALHHEASGTMVSGDIVSQNGHFMYSPLYWDLDAYETGLRRVRECDPDRLLPGHGDPMDDPRARVADALEKFEAAKAVVVDAVEAHGRLSARELARAALGATDATVDYLSSVAAAYAIHLAETGQIEVERTPGVVVSPA